MPPGLKLVRFDALESNLKLLNRNEDFTKFYFRRLNELRAGEELTCVATVESNQPGVGTIELQAESVDVVGTSTGRDNIVTQN